MKKLLLAKALLIISLAFGYAQTCPTVDAGFNQNVCETTQQVNLDATATNATSVLWTTSGTGTFSPNATTEDAIYEASAADINAGAITLTLTASAAGCPDVSDQMEISVSYLPTANAEPDKTVCDNVEFVSLSATGENFVVVGWSGGGGGEIEASTNLNATYHVIPQDIQNGSATFLFEVVSEGNCPTATDELTITFVPVPTADAGINQTVCSNVSGVSLNGIVGGSASGGTWSTNGTGSFSPNATTLNATYAPSSGDISNGSVQLTLTTSGGCSTVTDKMTISFTGIATANAGIDQTKCGEIPSTLNPTIGGSTAGSWTTSGSGTFSPDANTLNATYTPSAADVSSGSVTLTLTTSGGSCGTASDQMVITYSSTPLVNAGADQTICPEDEVSLTGSVSGTIATWTTSGSGTFSPNANLENVTYIPSAADKTSGAVTLTLTSSGGTCASVSDEMQLTITNVCVTGINSSQSVDNLIKIYPNPAIEYTEIEISQGIAITDISIYNILGEKVGSSEVLDAVVLINMENLSRGFYYFIFTDKSGSKYTKRIIKQ